MWNTGGVSGNRSCGVWVCAMNYIRCGHSAPKAPHLSSRKHSPLARCSTGPCKPHSMHAILPLASPVVGVGTQLDADAANLDFVRALAIEIGSVQFSPSRMV